MTDKKPEIHLELCSGSFRIPTEDAILNIKVVASEESSATRVVERIVEKERSSESSSDARVVPAEVLNGEGDQYYERISKDIYNEIGNLAKSLSSTLTEIPAEDRRAKRAELNEAGEKIESAKNQLKEIVDITEKATMEILDQVEKVQSQTGDVKELLSSLKDHNAFKVKSEDGAASPGKSDLIDEIAALRTEVEEASAMAEEMARASVPDEIIEVSPAPAVDPVGQRRFQFDLDVVFQTMYELCTNETVKEHLTRARKEASTLFDYQVFVADISDQVNGLEADADNFMQVPLSSILGPLRLACSDKSFQNLMKNMDANQASIFLDSSLPLEVPEIVLAQSAEPQTEAEPPTVTLVDPRLGALAELLAGLSPRLDGLTDKAERFSESDPTIGQRMTLEEQRDIFKQIEQAFEVISAITVDSSKITEVLSFQDLSGQQIMKIIKLLSDFQVQLLALVVSFGSQLKNKETNTTISPEESKRLAQGDVDRYLSSISGPVVGEGSEGMLDQQAVNSMLEEMGF
ncbi:MAG: protein phosphatase CheZ [Proteobacteria bacterium]|nr:protein phosphatase CheZ [Pseudomonadota bacterium]MBU1685830.1 protein phosphatase CheZ [Pseudomonadota bacterium]